jgi:carbamoyl-phosphate synthase small subunit
VPGLAAAIHEGRKRAVLALADGEILHGWGFGGGVAAVGEVVFNTCMTGYQEVVTDPSYHRQIVVMTPVQMGNTGVNPEDGESARPWVSGFAVREFSPVASSWRARENLQAYFYAHGVTGIEGIDTRALTRHLRDHGAQAGCIGVGDDLDPRRLVEKARAFGSMEGRNLVGEVTCERESVWEQGPYHHLRGFSACEPRWRVVAVDCGIKRNILRVLAGEGCRVTVVPAGTPAARILALAPDGVLLSNGPGDPGPVAEVIESVRVLLGRVPVFGICLGHQILGLALGGRTYKLAFGHHGGNHPVKNLATGGVEITSQNHGFVVDPDSLKAAGQNVEVTHINLNDGTVEGIRHLDLPAFSVQYHPEAAPGPHDSRYLFRTFTRLMSEHRGS